MTYTKIMANIRAKENWIERDIILLSRRKGKVG